MTAEGKCGAERDSKEPAEEGIKIGGVVDETA